MLWNNQVLLDEHQILGNARLQLGELLLQNLKRVSNSAELVKVKEQDFYKTTKRDHDIVRDRIN